ncbi:DnaA N-terminal domain-containing protein [Jannaschia pohangensis]|uniref:DnaA N-terminal domain-containing protein n=1 Tax=Jannaschia pohangensis TaxID=390807 RepID=A0A1I3UIW6_9RHOB|nr:DnaA N-terminal domain-containing protein [Jannaschia pohangensis]SFJ82980.1 hypothetical protein SAMN04488095_3773 [Jannaschia pohangensis]
MKMDSGLLKPGQFNGPQAGSAKYDVLTALALIGMQGGGALQVSALRLIAVITARYNWRQDEFCVCQRDMARMWGVTERTVKREVRAWQAARLVVCKRLGARGRAGAYRLDLVEIWQKAAEFWPLVGPDHAERLTPVPVVSEPSTVSDTGKTADNEPVARGTWLAASRRLRLVDPAQHAAWIAGLQMTSDDGSHVVLSAPSRFAAHYVQTHLMTPLAEAVEAEIGRGRRITIVPRTA